MLTQASGDRMVRLFVTKKGASFCVNNSIFTQFWGTLMAQHGASRYGLAYFPPNQARTIFVDDYLSQNGVPPDMWDGACGLRSGGMGSPRPCALVRAPWHRPCALARTCTLGYGPTAT